MDSTAKLVQRLRPCLLVWLVICACNGCTRPSPPSKRTADGDLDLSELERAIDSQDIVHTEKIIDGLISQVDKDSSHMSKLKLIGDYCTASDWYRAYAKLRRMRGAATLEYRRVADREIDSELLKNFQFDEKPVIRANGKIIARWVPLRLRSSFPKGSEETLFLRRGERKRELLVLMDDFNLTQKEIDEMHVPPPDDDGYRISMRFTESGAITLTQLTLPDDDRRFHRIVTILDGYVYSIHEPDQPVYGGGVAISEIKGKSMAESLANRLSLP